MRRLPRLRLRSSRLMDGRWKIKAHAEKHGPLCLGSDEAAALDVEGDVVEGVAGGERGAAVCEEGQADQIRTRDGEAGFAGRGDANDAALAVQRGHHVEVI